MRRETEEARGLGLLWDRKVCEGRKVGQKKISDEVSYKEASAEPVGSS